METVPAWAVAAALADDATCAVVVAEFAAALVALEADMLEADVLDDRASHADRASLKAGPEVGDLPGAAGPPEAAVAASAAAASGACAPSGEAGVEAAAPAAPEAPAADDGADAFTSL